mmetsp:Transcript_27436/g.62421  ORF Transcript_27436/g.62421 Transcript_27436/m.62421 type:complete len:288 (+) Transcript_27436:974-1837(+)
MRLATPILEATFRSARIGMPLKTCVRATVLIFSILSSPMVENKSWRLKDTTTTSVAARTVAERGMSYITASSPKKAPFLSCVMTTSLPSTTLMASHTPCSMMKSCSPISPCEMMLHPLLNVFGFNLPTSKYCSALERMSKEKRGILAMCCRSSWSADMTTTAGTCKRVTSVMATSVVFALALLFVKHSPPKYVPGIKCSGAWISDCLSSRRPSASPSCSATLPTSRTKTDSMGAPLAWMTAHFLNRTCSAACLMGSKKTSDKRSNCGICRSKVPFMASPSVATISPL